MPSSTRIARGLSEISVSATAAIAIRRSQSPTWTHLTRASRSNRAGRPTVSRKHRTSRVGSRPRWRLEFPIRLALSRLSGRSTYATRAIERTYRPHCRSQYPSRPSGMDATLTCRTVRKVALRDSLGCDRCGSPPWIGSRTNGQPFVATHVPALLARKRPRILRIASPAPQNDLPIMCEEFAGMRTDKVTKDRSGCRRLAAVWALG